MFRVERPHPRPENIVRGMPIFRLRKCFTWNAGNRRGGPPAGLRRLAPVNGPALDQRALHLQVRVQQHQIRRRPHGDAAHGG